MGLKTCSKCKTEKPLAEFHKNKNKKDGTKNYCKCCAKSYRKTYYEANREELKAQNKAYRESNREKIRVQRKAYRESNREELKAQKEAYRKTPRGRFFRARDSAKRRGIEFLLTEEQAVELIKKPCTYCGKPGPSGIDRIDSNGVYAIENCDPCCGTCNIRKSTKSKEVFLQEIKEGKWN